MSEERDPRIFFAAERTLLAWNRTSLSLIAFGFLVERAGLLMRVLAPEDATNSSLVLIFWAGMGLIGLGVFTAIFSSRQYLKQLKSLTPAQLPEGYNAKWAIGVNLVVFVLALILIVALVLEHQA